MHPPYGESMVKTKRPNARVELPLAASICAAVLCGSVLAPGAAFAINGGEEADRPYEFMGSIQTLTGEQKCGGALIADRWLLSAKHCFFDEEGAPYDWSQLKVRLGSNDRTTGGEIRTIASVKTVDNDTTPSDNDLALVELERPSTKTPIPLADHAPKPGEDVRAIGWGDHLLPEQPGDPWPEPPTMLRQLDQKVVDPLLCDAPEPIGYIQPGDVCVGTTPKGETTRAGDSGGPLLVPAPDGYTVAGVVSFAGWLFTPGRDVHAIFTSTNRFQDWITDTITTNT